MTSVHFKKRQRVMPQRVAAFCLVLVAFLVAADPDLLPFQQVGLLAAKVADLRITSLSNAPPNRQPVVASGSSDSDVAPDVEVLQRF